MFNKKIIGSLTLLLIIFSFTLQLTISRDEYKLVYTTNLYLLAIRENSGGIVINTTLNIYYPGSGSVIIKVVDGKIAPDTIASIKYAIVLASIITGVNYKMYDYEYIFPSGTHLRGPSATLEFFLSITAFFQNTSFKNRVSATGVIAPNGLIGLVEGIMDKYRAGTSFGLTKIIGPPYPNSSTMTRYYGVIDVWNAYEIYTGHQIYGVRESFKNKEYSEYMLHRERIKQVFKYSYEFFINRSQEIIETLENMGLSINKSFIGIQYLSLAFKYNNTKQWYTAATYAFRAYIEIHSLLVNYISRTYGAELLNYIDNIGRQAENQLEDLGREIYDTLSNIRDLWDLDVLVNVFIRYYIALEAYDKGRITGNLLEKARLYIIALARTYTAKHWLMLLENKSFYGRWFSSKEYLLADDILRDYLIHTINYLNALGMFSNETTELLLNGISNITGKPLNIFINYTTTLYELGLLTQNLEPPIFSQFIDRLTIYSLNNTLKQLTFYIWNNTHILLPSSITLNELITNYMIENESLDTIGFLYSSELSSLIAYLALIHAENLISPSYKGETKTIIRYITIEPPINIYYTIISLLLSIGAFLIGYSMRKR